jgi:hypothetical protein
MCLDFVDHSGKHVTLYDNEPKFEWCVVRFDLKTGTIKTCA